MNDTLFLNILRNCAFMQWQEICCHQFEPAKDMLALFNTDMNDKDKGDDLE